MFSPENEKQQEKEKILWYYNPLQNMTPFSKGDLKFKELCKNDYEFSTKQHEQQKQHEQHLIYLPIGLNANGNVEMGSVAFNDYAQALSYRLNQEEYVLCQCDMLNLQTMFNNVQENNNNKETSSLQNNNNNKALDNNNDDDLPELEYCD